MNIVDVTNLLSIHQGFRNSGGRLSEPEDQFLYNFQFFQPSSSMKDLHMYHIRDKDYYISQSLFEKARLLGNMVVC